MTFIVTDDSEPELSDEETITITIGDVNRPPVLDAIGNLEVGENEQLVIELTASDPDEDELTFDAENLPEGAGFEGDTFTWTPDYEQAGQYEVTFSVSDDEDPPLFDEETITITVVNTNRPPVLAEIGDREVDENDELVGIVTARDLVEAFSK